MTKFDEVFIVLEHAFIQTKNIERNTFLVQALSILGYNIESSDNANEMFFMAIDIEEGIKLLGANEKAKKVLINWIEEMKKMVLDYDT